MEREVLKEGNGKTKERKTKERKTKERKTKGQEVRSLKKRSGYRDGRSPKHGRGKTGFRFVESRLQLQLKD